MTTALTPETRPAGSPIPRGSRPVRLVRLVVVLAAGLAVVAALSILVGSTMIDPLSVVAGTGTESERAIVGVRVTRTALALLVGAALGAAGACLQGMARNPLADPGILGVNAGAALAIVLGISYLGLGGMRDYVVLGLIGAAYGARRVLAGLLGYQVREEKAAWQDVFRVAEEVSVDETAAVDDAKALGGLVLAPPDPAAAAGSAGGGELSSAELDEDNGVATWEVQYGEDTPDELTVEVDATTGEVLRTERDD